MTNLGSPLSTDAGRACVAAARAGAEVLLDAHGRRSGQGLRVSRKGRINLVTEVDERAEAIVVETLQRLAPGVPILAEEGGETAGDRADCRFIVDPLDGTTNFTHGYPVFCVSIAFEAAGQVVSGAVLDPVRSELFTAEAGRGAWLGSRRLRTSVETDLDAALLATGFPYTRAAMEEALELFAHVLLRVRAVRRAGSAALDLCSVAAGRLDGFWEETLRAWDTAAGELIVREAGGRVTDFAGKAFRNGGPNIAATNGPLHPALLAVLGRGPEPG